MNTHPNNLQSNSPGRTVASATKPHEGTNSRLLAKRIFAHALTGLLVGILIHLVQASCLAVNAHGPTQAEAAVAQQLSLLWLPVGTTIFGALLPFRYPIKWLTHGEAIWCQIALGIIAVIFDLLVVLYTFLIWQPPYFG